MEKTMQTELDDNEDGGMQMLAVWVAVAWAVVTLFCGLKSAGWLA